MNLLKARLSRRQILRAGLLGFTTPLIAACSTAVSIGTPTPRAAGEAKPSTPVAQVSGEAAGDVVKWFVRTNPLENKWQDDYAIPEYKKRQPKVVIQKIVVPGTEFNAKLFALQAAGDTPNMFGFAAFATYWARGLALPIDDYLQREQGLREQYFPHLFDTYRWWGKYWGLPMAPRFGTMCFYNADLFDQAGVPYPPIDFTLKDWNVDVMLDKALKLTKNYGKPDVIFGINFGPWSPHGLAYLWGGDTYTKAMYEQGIDDHTTVDSEASRDAHQFKLDLIQKYKVHPATSDYQTISVLGNPFKTGRIAMNVEGGWAWSTFSDIKQFRWAVAPVPGKKDIKNSENNNIWMLGNTQRGRDATWEFMKFTTSADSQRAWVQITGAQPSRPDVLDEWIKLHSNHMPAEDIKKLITENIKHTVESMDHMVVDFARFDDTYNQEVAALWDGKVPLSDFMTRIKQKWDAIAKEIYDQYKDRLLRR